MQMAVDVASIVWAIVALAAVVACWDGVRRYSAGNGIEARCADALEMHSDATRALLDQHEAATNRRFASLGEKNAEQDKAIEHVAGELAREVNNLRAHAGIRAIA